MRVHFSNLGCKLNQAEIESLARSFSAAGHTVVGSLEAADLHVVNSCTVTHVAARDSRKMARRASRIRPELRTVLTGCYSTEQPEAAAVLAGVDLVVPNAEKDRLLERVVQAFPELPPAATDREVPCALLETGHTRALVKVEDGCDMRCSFCIIPSTRGQQRSRSPEEVVEEVAQLVSAGAREVVITGVQISSYRAKGGERLADLTRMLLQRTRVERLRLSSIAPWQFDDRLVELLREPRLCRHVHLSLQSGCSRTLRRMRRPYSAEQFRSLTDRLHETIPGLAITTDVIVGFPGETEADFEVSSGFVAGCCFAKVHAFPFSPREGTEAATMPEPVPHPEIRRRMVRMLEVAEVSEQAFRSSHLDATVEVLWERSRRGLWQGLTDNYLRIWVESEADLHNRLLPVRTVGLHPQGLWGELV